MPVQPTFPGVYIEEVPSGVRTITGVATSITAFLGRAPRGPVNEPVTINSFADYERIFGGLSNPSTMSFAVSDFYLNGGSRGVIVRLFRPFFSSEAKRDLATAGAQLVVEAANTAASATGATPASVADAAALIVESDQIDTYEKRFGAQVVANAAKEESERTDDPPPTPESVRDAAAAAVDNASPITKAQLIIDDLTLEAAYEGAWGNKLTAEVNHDVRDSADPKMFNLTITDLGTEVIEVFRNVSVKEDNIRRVDKVLEQESRLVRVLGDLPDSRPSKTNGNSIEVLPANQATDGEELTSAEYIGSENDKEGIFALEDTDLFNILCLPPYTFEQDVESNVWEKAATYCEEKRRAMLIVDSPNTWKTKEQAVTGIRDGVGTRSKNAAIFFPRLRRPNVLRDNRIEEFVPCGAVAGIFARTDSQRGVWKAPAGLDATLRGVSGLSVLLSDDENGELNPLGVNCLRFKPPAGRIVWGARTLQGDDRLASEWKYIPIRRTALFLEESLFRGTQWVVFEPNDEPLWAQIRLNVGAFMQNLFLQGAFQGATPREAYLVKCDSETTTQNDINLGIVNILVGFAPLKPAEFVFIKIQQLAGQIEA